MTGAEKEQSLEPTRGEVQNWLIAEGWKISEQPHPAAEWLLRAEDTAGHRILVGKNAARSDRITLEARVDLSDELRRHFEILPEEKRNRILWDLRFRLLMMNVEFSGVSEPLMAVVISQIIFLDGFTKKTFLQRFSLVRNAVVTVIWSVMQYLENVEPPAESTKSKTKSAGAEGGRGKRK